MKHLKLFFALFAMLALGVGNAWAVEVTMTAGSNGSACTVNGINGIKVGTSSKGGDMIIKVPAGATSLQLYAAAWNGVTGLSIDITPKSNVNPTSISLTADGGISGGSFAFTLEGDAESFKHEVTLSNITSETTLTLTSSKGKRFVVWGATCTVAEGENPGEGGGDEPADVLVKTLKSIAVADMTTTYEEGDKFGFDGTCTATYSVVKNEVAQEDEQKVVTPTSVSEPNMSTTGEQEVTVTYTEDNVTVKATYTINVTENVITAGEYALALNNKFFGTSEEATVENFPTSAQQNDITVTLGGGGAKTRTDADCVRMYQNNTLTFSVPAGYVITSITFAEPSSDKKWDGSITVDAGTYTDATKSWAGSEQEVVFSFGAQNRIATATVTYAEAGETPVEPEVPENLGAKTIAEFLALKNTTDTCVLTGVVANIANTTYGNFDLVDATGSVYVYGLLTAAGESKKFASMDIAAGDTLTVKAIYNEYNSNPQAKNAIYVSHRKLVLTVAVTSENGTVNGLADGGKYVRGTEVTLTATAADGYEFVNWTKGEEVVSTENPYTFTVTADVALVANFKIAGPATALENIAVEGKTVKAIVNGQLIIIKNGVQYNAQGQVIK